MTTLTQVTERATAASRGAQITRFDPGDPTDRAALYELLEANPGLQVQDTLEVQVRDLVRARQAGRKPSQADIAAFWRAEAPEHPERWGRWIHYAWLNLVLRTLPPTELRALRTDRNRYRILASEQRQLGALRVAIAGLSVGQSIAVCMAQEGVGGTFHLADPDTLDLSNLNRLRGGLDTLGTPKVDLAARAMLRLDPYLTITTFPDGVVADELDAFLCDATGRPLDLLIEECDDLPLKILMRRRARALGIPVLMATAEGGLMDLERFDLEPDRPLFHGLAANIDLDALAAGDEGARVAFVMAVLGLETLSPRTGVSLLEGGVTLASWPQLASSVALGAALVTDAARRVALGELRTSGRWRVPLSQLEPEVRPPADETGSPAPPPHPALWTAAQAPSAADLARLAERVVAVGIDGETRQALLDLAVLAPSGGNAQPWRIGFDGDTLTIADDLSRPVPGMDPHRVSVRMAAGSVVETVAIAAEALGLRADVAHHDSGVNLATVTLSRRDEAASSGFSLAATTLGANTLATAVAKTAAPSAATTAAYAEAIRSRCTNRHLHVGPGLDAADRRALTQAAAAAGAMLVLLEETPARAAIGRVAGRADRLRFLHGPWRRELATELRWTAAEAAATADGLELDSLELTPAARAGLPLMLHEPTMTALADARLGGALIRPAEEAFVASAALAAIVVPPQVIDPLFVGGRALQRVWLAATLRDVGVHPWGSALFCFAAMRSPERLPAWMLAEISTMQTAFAQTWPLPAGTPVMLLRLHRGPAPTARAPRRRVRLAATSRG